MRCGCGGRLLVRHTYSAGQAKTQDAVCDLCAMRHTLVTFSVRSDPEHGQGAYAVAERIRRGETVEVGDGRR